MSFVLRRGSSISHDLALLVDNRQRDLLIHHVGRLVKLTLADVDAAFAFLVGVLPFGLRDTGVLAPWLERDGTPKSVSNQRNVREMSGRPGTPKGEGSRWGQETSVVMPMASACLMRPARLSTSSFFMR